MKFLTITVTLFTTLASAAEIARRAATPDLFHLTSSKLPGLIWTPLMFANGSAYIGNAKYDIWTEPLLINGGEEKNRLSFTSFHSTPTGWTNLYVFGNQSKPISFTTPHSGFVPPGAITTGFGSKGGYFTLNQGKGPKEKWKACPTKQEGTWQIYWDGNQKKPLGPKCTSVRLKIGKTKECRLPPSF